MLVKILPEPFDPWIEASGYQNASEQMTGKFGATNLFVGTMRDFNEGDDIAGMALEHYPGMTEKALETIMKEAAGRWPVIDALVVHRVGDILPGDPIVLVAVWTSHRGDAFDASRYIMEALKSRAPFWKKELLRAKGERWVAQNTDGYLKSE
jgi:molybdopterin synthase catalytic subunit